MFKKVNDGVVAVTKGYTYKEKKLWEAFRREKIDITIIPAREVRELLDEFKIAVPVYLVYKGGEFLAWSKTMSLDQYNKIQGRNTNYKKQEQYN